VRPSAGELSQASFARGPLPVTPNSANLRYSDRQAASVPRNTAPARVFSYRQPAPVQRTTFGEQRGFQQTGGALPSRPVETPSAAGNRTPSGWTRFGAPVGQSALPSGSGAAIRNESAGQRFGESRVTPTPSADPAVQRGWSRFGEPYSTPRQSYAPQASQRNSAPSGNYQFNPGSRPEPLRVTPPVVRERQEGAARFGAPGGGGSSGPRGGGFSAPRTSSGGDRGSRSNGNNRGGHNR
jgi:hypothetical protein